MEDKESVYAQFAEHFSTLEETEAYVRKEAEEQSEASQEWVEVSKGVFVSPKQAHTQLFGTETAGNHDNAAIKSGIKPSSTSESNQFTAMLNGYATNQLTNIGTRYNPPKVDAVTGNATIEKGTLKVLIEKYNELTGGLRTSTYKLLDVCTIALTQQNTYRGNAENINPLVIFPLERFMELCGMPLTKPYKDKARRKVKEDLKMLYHISMEWTETRRGESEEFDDIRLCQRASIKDGNIRFYFSDDMAKYLIKKAYITQYNTELLKVDERNPHSYHIGKKLLLHYSIDNNIKKGTANILSVKSLLEACPDMPSHEQVLATGRQLDQRIRAPFENALNSLSFIRWEYCNSKGMPLTEEQLQAKDYSTFIKLYVKFDVLGAPDQTARLERKAERLEQTKKKKRATSKKKKPAEG